jgi:hypothetical protein
MRLWTLHPRYLDTKGLLAVWREALLAQQVVQNKTKGYRHHPQLRRFTSSSDAVAAIAAYLREIHREAVLRGYRFNEEKITDRQFSGKIACTRGQLLYEWDHLRRKLKERDPDRYREMEKIEAPDSHPLFEIIEGGKEDWEKGIE